MSVAVGTVPAAAPGKAHRRPDGARRRVPRRGRGRRIDPDRGTLPARQPQVVLIDKPAHANVPGAGRHAKRRRDVEDILAAGIDVVTALNIRHLESLGTSSARSSRSADRRARTLIRRAARMAVGDEAPTALVDFATAETPRSSCSGKTLSSLAGSIVRGDQTEGPPDRGRRWEG
ncbi:hypothetical protein [Streptomyces sp. NPDC090445]|uniref:hypothetical protein n=1 Tax=Streptomyces sp. NPDC090445 TaxID=3365963 RepID=UPI0038033CB5